MIEERNNYNYHLITFMLILTHVLLTDPKKKNNSGWNALHFVCHKASSDVDITEVVKLLIERYFALLFTISFTTHIAMYTY